MKQRNLIILIVGIILLGLLLISNISSDMFNIHYDHHDNYNDEKNNNYAQNQDISIEDSQPEKSQSDDSSNNQQMEPDENNEE